MKVILNEDIKGMGKKGTMVNVSDGYARNYLLPKGLASEANAGNINIMKSKQEAEKNREAKETANAREIARQLEGITLTMRTRTGENGKLFGSITTKDIADKLKADHKIDIDKKKLVHEEAFKHTGDYELDVKLYPGVTGKLKLKLESE